MRISLRTITNVVSVIPIFFSPLLASIGITCSLSCLTFWAPPNITAYLLTSTLRLRKLELMSATISRSLSDMVSS